MDLLLGHLTLQHQLLIGQLQVSGRQVQLLVHFGVLFIHMPQRVQLFGQILGGGGSYLSKLCWGKCLCLGPPPTSRNRFAQGYSFAAEGGGQAGGTTGLPGTVVQVVDCTRLWVKAESAKMGYLFLSCTQVHTD